MGIEVTNRFSGTKFRKRSFAWIATETWHVIGTADKPTAIDAAVQHNDAHPDNPNMRVSRRDADNLGGPFSWMVSADYEFGDHGLCADSPLGELPLLMWEVCGETIPIEYDGNNVAILNSAGSPFDPSLTDSLPRAPLIVRKWEPFYSVGRSLGIRNRVNSDAFTVAGAGGVSPGQAWIDYYKPLQPYTNAAPFVQVEYRFEFRDGVDPFQPRVIDQGRVGWYQDSTSHTPYQGPIVDAKGNPATFDIRLDGTGKPIDTRWKVADDKGNAQTPISAPSGLVPQPVIDHVRSSAFITVLIFYTKLAIPFGGLL